MKSIYGNNYWIPLNFEVLILMGWNILSLRHLKGHGPALWVALIMSILFDFGDALCY